MAKHAQMTLYAQLQPHFDVVFGATWRKGHDHTSLGPTAAGQSGKGAAGRAEVGCRRGEGWYYVALCSGGERQRTGMRDDINRLISNRASLLSCRCTGSAVLRIAHRILCLPAARIDRSVSIITLCYHRDPCSVYANVVMPYFGYQLKAFCIECFSMEQRALAWSHGTA